LDEWLETPVRCGDGISRPTSVKETEKIWLDGELVDWGEARVHVGVHALHYGSGVFEGIRCYDTSAGPAVFRLEDHIRRLHDSARLLYMEIPYSAEELCNATCELVRVNQLASCYIRPISFYGYGSLAVSPEQTPVTTAILCWPWGAYLGDGSQERGITAKISTWERIGPNVIPHTAKATGIYLNSMLATMEAQRAGYQEAILLAADGTIADGPGETIFVVKDGLLKTPPLTSSILPGITRDSVISLAFNLGYPIEEQRLIRSDLVLADEVFMTGTAAEVTPVRAVEDVEIGVGDVTRELQRAYRDVVTGADERWAGWLRHVGRTPEL
jgi:branched-chain amino acid aminotransferase